MKALTILQPWAELIASGVKRIENRSWPTSYRGPLAIHAGKGRRCFDVDADAWRDFYGVRMPLPDEVTFGAVIAIATLTACVPRDSLAKEFPELAGSPFAEGPYCWVLTDVRRIEPVPFSGKQMLWEFPDATL